MTTQLNPLMFRAYDIRGIVGSDLTEQAAVLIGKGIGTYLQQRSSAENSGQANPQLVVGGDNRLSTESLKHSLIEGLLSTGCDVVDIGLCTSPLLYIADIIWAMDGGIMITGSHNPANYNGFKVIGPGAYPIGGDEIERLRDLTLAGAFCIGQGRCVQKDAQPDYFAKIEQTIRLARPIKVAIDTGNGAAGLTVPALLKKLGCEVVEVFTDLDGNFPNHLPNPENEAYLSDLKQRVVETGAELGLGFDGDGDRIGLINEHGVYLEADYVVMLLAQDFLSRHPGQKVLVDVKASQNTVDVIRQHGGQPIMWKTGHSLVKQKMREDHIIFGGELSGHMFVFEDYYPVDDALYAACRLLQFLSKNDKKLSDYFVNLPKKYSTRLIEVHCDDAVKFDVVHKMQQIFLKQYDVNTIDGARINFPGGWALVRVSNTTPNIVLRFEADSAEQLEAIQREVFGTLERFMPK